MTSPGPGPTLLDDDLANRLALRAGQIFRPAAPITQRELFAGRVRQMRQLIDSIYQPGQHVVLYGERGVGKTSLANVVDDVLKGVTEGPITTKVNCDRTDDFGSVWKKALENITFVTSKPTAGFSAEDAKEIHRLSESLPKEDVRVHDVFKVLRGLPRDVVLIFDEFDRLPRCVRQSFTDVIKGLSDYDLESTTFLVGVADTVDELLEDHASIDRALVQVPMPRMSEGELSEIVDKATSEIGVPFSDESRLRIVRLSQGLPHYTHLIGLNAIRAALEERRPRVEDRDVDHGVSQAVEAAQHSIKTLYQKAIRSARRDALFEQVLLACAIAPKDPLSFFRPGDVVQPMTLVMGKKYEIPAFQRHLNDFCNEKRGPALERAGHSRSYRYRFKNPLLQPFAMMRGLAKGLLPAQFFSPHG